MDLLAFFSPDENIDAAHIEDTEDLFEEDFGDEAGGAGDEDGLLVVEPDAAESLLHGDRE